MSARARSVLTVALVLGALGVAGTWHVGAQILPLPSSTTTTVAPNAPTTRPGAAPPPPTTALPVVPPEEADLGADGGLGPPGGVIPVPHDARSIINGVARSAPNDNLALLAQVATLEETLGISSHEAMRIGMGRFPVAGPATFVHDWLYPRWGPAFRFHLGTDIMAAHGTPVRSPAAGTVRLSNSSLGGLATYVTEADGTFYYLAHLSAFVEGMADGDVVAVGDIVGFVGQTGNASSPHVHFAVHPLGGAPTDPKPVLDRWIDEAMGSIPSLVDANTVTAPRGLLATRLLRGVVAGAGTAQGSGAASGSSTEVLWASSANPSGGGLRVVEGHAAALAASVDWGRRAAEQDQIVNLLTQSDLRARALLDRLTPRIVANTQRPFSYRNLFRARNLSLG